MADLLLTLVGGIVLVLVTFAGLRRFTRLRAAQCGALAALAAVGAYLATGPSLTTESADIVTMHLAVYLVTAYILGVLAGHRPAGARRGFHWGPAVILGFFGFVFLTSAVTVVVSRSGLPGGLGAWLFPSSDTGSVQLAFPGVVARDFQKKEALYNRYLEQVEVQRARGWQVRKGWLTDPVAEQPAVFQVAVADREGREISGATITGRFLRPSDSRKDQAFSLKETGPGVYQATLALPEPGTWELLLEVRRGEDLHEVRATTTVAGRG